MLVGALLVGCFACAVGLDAAVKPTAVKPSDGVASDEKLERKSVTGQVTYVGKRALSVEYQNTAEGLYEMLLPFSESMRLAHLRSLSELKQGDTVRVQYEQTYREGEKSERVILKTIVKEIALIKRASAQQLGSREAE